MARSAVIPQPRALRLATLVLLFCAAAHARTDPKQCSQGCSGVSKAVCGADGFTYLNACVAECQGVAIAATGPCTADGASNGAVFSTSKAGGTVTKKEMEAFKKQGYRFIGFAQTVDFEGVPTLKAKPAFAQNSDKFNATVVQVTADGNMYAAPDNAAELLQKLKDGKLAPSAKSAIKAPRAGSGKPKSGPKPKRANMPKPGNSTVSVKLINGNDDRREIPFHANWPWSTAGLIEYMKTDGRSSTCSGVMISRRTVLTAAHCIAPGRGGLWFRNIRFSPNAFVSSGVLRRPLGTFSARRIVAFNGWLWNHDWKYDIAVIQLWDENVGGRTGWLGTSFDDAGFRGWVSTNGYPGDKPRGSYWYQQAWVRDPNGRDAVFNHQMDVYFGQSGSPVWYWNGGSQYYVRAVMSYQWCSECTQTVSAEDDRCVRCLPGEGGNVANGINSLSFYSLILPNL